jgi:tetratricopeptide (TPR) repeat protein
MSLYRKTAILQLELPSGATAERLPLTAERAYGVILTIDGQSYPAGYFYSPINDEQWRDFSQRLSDCNVRHAEDAAAYRNATFIRGIGMSLYKTLAALNPDLQSFLNGTAGPRRLVVQTTRPELHLLPWGALYAGGGNLLCAADLSIVQAFDRFSQSLAVTQSRLNLLRVAGDDTNAATATALQRLPPEIVQLPPGDTSTDLQMLHVEAHGDKATNSIGGVSAESFGERYANVTMAMLWSCYSSSANSWGDSPALCLHQAGTAMVLSFQAELHVSDASSLAEGLYGDVFGPAASRNPESALVQLRADKYAKEFPHANWASMTVFLRCPLDLTALPLNGPRVPKAQWIEGTQPPGAGAGAGAGTSQFSAEAAAIASRLYPGGYAGEYGADPTIDTLSALQRTGTFAARSALPDDAHSIPPDQEPWAAIAETVRTLQPGAWKPVAAPPEVLAAPAGAPAKLPASAFGAWRGNVIRLDGGNAPLNKDILRELDLLRSNPPIGHDAESLVWFFDRIAHYGSPLIVWTNSLPRHLEFLKVVGPSPALTFLLLGGAEPEPTIPALVDENRLDEARTAAEALPLEDPATHIDDETLSAAYYACVRGVRPDLARRYLKKLQSFQEWLLLMGNLFSRDRKNVLGPVDLMDLGGRFLEGETPVVSRAEFDLLRRPEDFYRLAMNQPPELASPRETARAKHELAYLLQSQGRPSTAEVFYRLALADLECCDNSNPGTTHDNRWHFALSGVLRDLADLLSTDPCRLDEASALLKRAMAIQAYHGMELQLGYSETTAARIALTGGHHTHAITNAVNAANRMEACVNWTGWSEALGILFDTLAETRETARMVNLANLANQKIRASNLSPDNIKKQERLFKFEKAKAHWIAGDLDEARDEFESIASDAPPDEKNWMDREIDRLLNFLRVERPGERIAERPSLEAS